MSAPVTHEEAGLVITLLVGGGLLMFGAFVVLSCLVDITPSQRSQEFNCGCWLVGIGLVVLTIAAIGATW